MSEIINAALPVIFAGVLNLYSGNKLITEGLMTVCMFSELSKVDKYCVVSSLIVSHVGLSYVRPSLVKLFSLKMVPSCKEYPLPIVKRLFSKSTWLMMEPVFVLFSRTGLSKLPFFKL